MKNIKSSKRKLEYMKKWRKDNKPKIKEYLKKPEVKKKQKEYLKNNYNKNKSKRLDYYKKWRIKNKQKTKEYDKGEKRKIWRQNNPKKLRDYEVKRRVTEMKIIHDFSSAEWLAKLEATRGVCSNCNKFVGVENLTLDHKHPISKAVEGQVYTINDVQPLCKSCNSSKGSRVINNP